MKLSVCLALYNESNSLHYFLDSTKDIASEIVVVDGKSTDDTVTKLKAYGDKVRIISTPDVPMFHKMKQMSIDAAAGDWILQLDADEEIPDALKEEIMAVISHWKDGDPIAYRIPRKNYFIGRFLMKGGVYPDYTIRLYRKGTMYFPCKDVHENVAPVKRSESEDRNLNWLGTLKNPMNHYSDPTFARYFGRWKRYTGAEAARVVNEASRLYKSHYEFIMWKLKFLFKSFFILPFYWFGLTYFRHKGFLDGWQGFVFHFMSAIRWWGIGCKVIVTVPNT